MIDHPAIEIFSLNRKPDMIPVCGAWSFTEWGCQVPGRTLDQTIADYATRCQDENLPIMWIAMDHNKPAGMVSLKEEAHPDAMDLTPWMGSFFVHPVYRNKGLGARLIERAASHAKNGGYESIYAFSSFASAYYEKHGWREIRKVSDPMSCSMSGPEHQAVVMEKDL